MSHGDTIPLYASSQSDIDEIETLFHVSAQPAMSLPASVPPARPSSPPPATTTTTTPPAPLPPRTPVPFVSSSVKPAASAVDLPAPVPPNLSSNGPTGFGGGPGNNTLTEPVWMTIKRDVVRVSINLRSVVFPNPFREDPGKALRDWDLWGPFFFIVFLGVAISYSASTDNSKVFAVVFAVLAAGAVILTLNVLLLGGHIIFFQSLSLLGYCLFPLDIGALICMLRTHVIIRGIVVLLTLAWSSWAAYPFVSAAVSPNRKALAVYPVFLLYVSIGFFIFAV